MCRRFIGPRALTNALRFGAAATVAGFNPGDLETIHTIDPDNPALSEAVVRPRLAAQSTQK